MASLEKMSNNAHNINPKEIIMSKAPKASKKVKAIKKEIKSRNAKVIKQEGKLKKLKKALKKAA